MKIHGKFEYIGITKSLSAAQSDKNFNSSSYFVFFFFLSYLFSYFFSCLILKLFSMVVSLTNFFFEKGFVPLAHGEITFGSTTAKDRGGRHAFIL